MSHCPYGTQIEKGILPVLEALDGEIDFELKFCDYAMHAEKEIDEQLNQYCIQENGPEKLLAYLRCFLEADKGAECLKQMKINTVKLNACVSATDKQYKISEMFNDKSTWRKDRNGNPAFPVFNVDQADNQKYEITGSPGLVINGKKVASGRDPASLLKMICAGYENAPNGCSAELSSANPSPGFGFGTTAASTDAGCGS